MILSFDNGLDSVLFKLKEPSDSPEEVHITENYKAFAMCVQEVCRLYFLSIPQLLSISYRLFYELLLTYLNIGVIVLVIIISDKYYQDELHAI